MIGTELGVSAALLTALHLSIGIAAGGAERETRGFCLAPAIIKAECAVVGYRKCGVYETSAYEHQLLSADKLIVDDSFIQLSEH